TATFLLHTKSSLTSRFISLDEIRLEKIRSLFYFAEMLQILNPGERVDRSNCIQYDYSTNATPQFYSVEDMTMKKTAWLAFALALALALNGLALAQGAQAA